MDIKIAQKIIHKDIADVKPYWRNPRKNDKTVEALKAVIPNVGFNVPIYIDSDGFIIKGHARYRAACQLGMKEIPCIISENDEEQNRLDRIADNKISELAEWDLSGLQNEVETIDFDFSQIGMEVERANFDEMFEDDMFRETTENIEASIKEPLPPTPSVLPKPRIYNLVNAKCPKCGNPMQIRLEL